MSAHKKNSTITLNRIGELTAIDLTAEAAKDPSGVKYAWATNAASGELLWYPLAGRGGVCTNGDSIWTDASGPRDAIARYLSGEVVA